MKSHETVVIVNVEASRVQRSLSDLRKLLHKSFNDLEIVEVGIAKNLKNTIQKVLSSNPKRIIAVGGDGTILAVLKEADVRGYEKPIGIIPLGTANYLARNLGFTLTIQDAIDRIKRGNTRKLYIPEADGNYFTLMLTVGLTTEVSKNIDVSLKQRFGQFAYVFEAFRQLAKKEAFDYEITVDNKKTLRGTTYQIVVANADLNKQLQVVPASEMNKKWLRLSVYESNDSKVKLLGMILAYIATFGRYKQGLITMKAQKIEIRTNPVQSSAVDGEPITKTPITVQIHNRSVEIYT